MFVGTYEHTVDAKGRMFLPAKYREELGERMYLVKVVDKKALALYPEAEWQKFVARIDAQPQMEMRDIRRFIFSSAAEITLDGQGRLNIPQLLRDYAKLEKDVIVTGNSTFIEIWSKSGFADVTENIDNDALLKTLINLGF